MNFPEPPGREWWEEVGPGSAASVVGLCGSASLSDMPRKRLSVVWRVMDGARIPWLFYGSNFLFSDCCLVRPGHPWASNLQALLIFDTCYPLGAFVSAADASGPPASQ